MAALLFLSELFLFFATLLSAVLQPVLVVLLWLFYSMWLICTYALFMSLPLNFLVSDSSALCPWNQFRRESGQIRKTQTLSSLRGLNEGMVANPGQLCRIMVGISPQIRLTRRWPSRYGWCVNLQKNYSKPPRFDETSRFEFLCRYSEVQVSQSISESENGKRPALSRKRSNVLNIWQYYQDLGRK